MKDKPKPKEQPTQGKDTECPLEQILMGRSIPELIKLCAELGNDTKDPTVPKVETERMKLSIADINKMCSQNEQLQLSEMIQAFEQLEMPLKKDILKDLEELK
jgi:hypothetical protein